MPFNQTMVIPDNPQLRISQREEWIRIRDNVRQPNAAGEVGIVRRWDTKTKTLLVWRVEHLRQGLRL